MWSKFASRKLAAAAVLIVGAFLADATASAQSTQPASRATGLQIVVVEGEDAVNIVQQKTAVAPVVEVRDRNNQPVAGAVVRFAIRSGRATFNGSRALTVTTNAAGRAAVTGFAPTGAGSLQISATAAFQGQTAVATIVQTNVMTAAQAAAASASAGASGAGSGSAAGGGGAAGGGTGGGLSATTVGVVGGAAAGGLVVAKEVGLIGGGTKYSGQFSGTVAMVFAQCTRREQQSGTLQLEITEEGAAISGSAHVDGDIQILQPNPCGPPGYTKDSFGFGSAAINGSAGSLTFSAKGSNQYTDPDGTTGTNAYEYSFTGSKSGVEISGTLTVTRTITNNKGPIPGVGAISYSVTLR